MKQSNNAGPVRVLDALGISPDALLGQGSEAWVYALDEKRIARVSRGGTNRAQVSGRNTLLTELGRSAEKVPFEIPVVIETVFIEQNIVTIEQRLPGRPLDQILGQSSGETRDSWILAYLEAATQISELIIDRSWFGDLLDTKAIRTHSFQTYLSQRAGHSLQAAGRIFRTVNPAKLASALPEPDGAALVHLDFFPGNILAEDGVITAVLDFGPTSIMGDPRLGPLAAVAYLASLITITATDRDRAVALEWLITNDLASLYPAAQTWIAAYWSFARDDASLYRWCQQVLIGNI